MNSSPVSISTTPLSLLGRLLAKLDLTRTQRADLDRSYKAVTSSLLESNSLKGILRTLELRPQGSVRAGTVVRPADQSDFDLDILCWMEFTNTEVLPARVWELVWDALGEHKVYNSMRTPKPRCIRLKFKAGYHLDITPAVPDPAQPEPRLQVPDTALKSWSPSNPIGFCDDWLMKIAAKLPPAISCFGADRIFNTETAAHAICRKDRVEPLPEEDGGFSRAPLLKIIQLIKYLRDQTYSISDKQRPSSILLTTIAARAYDRELVTGHTSLREFILAVIEKLQDHVGVSKDGSGWRFSVPNPVHEDENFADKWTMETHQSFTRWANDLTNKVREVLLSESVGLDGRLRVLNSTIPGAAQFHIEREIGEDFRKLHDTSGLRLRAIPSVATSTLIVRPTTFYGNL